MILIGRGLDYSRAAEGGRRRGTEEPEATGRNRKEPEATGRNQKGTEGTGRNLKEPKGNGRDRKGTEGTERNLKQPKGNGRNRKRREAEPKTGRAHCRRNRLRLTEETKTRSDDESRNKSCAVVRVREHRRSDVKRKVQRSCGEAFSAWPTDLRASRRSLNRGPWNTISSPFPVAMTKGSHLFPSRTQKLSPSVPKVLGWRRPGRIGRCRIPIEKLERVSFLLS